MPLNFKGKVVSLQKKNVSSFYTFNDMTFSVAHSPDQNIFLSFKPQLMECCFVSLIKVDFRLKINISYKSVWFLRLDV